MLLKKNGGGRVAAREVLLNTPAVQSLLAEGKTSQLPLAIEGGRVHGMMPLNDALVGFVQSGVVDVREAYRRAVDRTGFLALLKRQGLDTSGTRAVRVTPLLLDERLQLSKHEIQHLGLGELSDRASADRPLRFRRRGARARGGCDRPPPARRRTCRETARCSPRPLFPTSGARFRPA